MSCRRTDPSFHPEYQRAKVLFNGREQHPKVTGRGVITADEEAGLILFYVFDEHGKPVPSPDPAREGRTLERVEWGEVKIVLRQRRD